MLQPATSELQPFELLASFTYDPLRYVLACWPWGEADGELADAPGPRTWQTKILKRIGEHVKNRATRYKPLRIAVASGNGIGKSALIAFVAKWAMGVCADAKVVITANTTKQLLTKTSPELAKWFRLAVDRDLWDVKTFAIASKDVGSEKTWRCDLIPWSENNPEAFAGLHNRGRIIVLMFDEASGIERVIWETAQGALTDEKTIIIWLAFGNPMRPDGPFAECFGSEGGIWEHHQIDSRTVEGINKEEIELWARTRGEDSDFFRVRVRGEFPIQGNAQFISSAVIHEARKFKAILSGIEPKILVVDVARFGEDSSVIGERQGRKFAILETFYGKSLDFTGERVIAQIRAEKPAAIVVDETGIGCGVLDYVRARGYNAENGYPIFGYNGGHNSVNPEYFDRRAECYGMAKDWLDAGAEIPDDPELARDLTSITFDYAKGKVKFGSIRLESKDEMKGRGLQSPDKGDTLAMSFHVQLAEARPLSEEEERQRRIASRPVNDWMRL